MRPRLRIAIVADDLTGAMDAAAPFAAAGLRTLARFDADNAVPPQIDVLSCNTETRHAAPDIAAARVARVVGSLMSAAPTILLKKIDSTLRGNVAAEIAAALRACKRRHVLVAPAAPAQGRTVRAGEVFVNGVALGQTEFARDVASPAATDPLHRLLKSSGADVAVQAWTRDAAMALASGEGLHAYVADAETEGELDRIAEFVLAHGEDILVVGSTGIGAALARQQPQHGAAGADLANLRESLQAARGRILFVVGSRTAVSAEQVTRLRAAGAREIVVPIASGQTVASLPLARGARQQEPSTLVLRPDVASGTAAHEVARMLARAAVDLLRRWHASMLVIVGGDTASATFAALGVRECALVGEILPGVPVGRVADRNGSMIVVTKSGGFGGAETLVEIIPRLRDR